MGSAQLAPSLTTAGGVIATEPLVTPVTVDTRRVLRGLYIGRIALAAGLFVNTVLLTPSVNKGSQIIAAGALFAAVLFTAVSLFLTEVRQRTATASLLYLQPVFDMILVTATVHVTWAGGQSQLAPLYILVIAVSALLVPPSGVPLVTSFGIVLYFADAMLGHGGNPSTELFLQLAVFAVVALSCGVLAARLRVASSGHDELAAEVAAFRLRETDMKRLTMRAARLEGIAEMSASLAHEIKNPLASIRSAVEQLSRMPRATDDEKVLSGLVQRESDRMARVLTEFLDFARTAVTKVEPLNLTEIARNAAQLAMSQPGLEQGVRVVDLFPPAPLMTEGDEDLIHRAVFNLLLNAVQASPPNGEVRLEGGELRAHQLPPGHEQFANGAIALFVTDRGAGIPPQIRDRLFDPFVTTKQAGSGLGLSIVQRAVEAHSGLVTVSPPGEETRFTLVLPKSK